MEPNATQGGAGTAADIRRDRFIAGDSLRALAALSVLVFHIWLPIALSRRAGESFGSTADRIFGGLQLGIYIFFALSGYLLARPFIRAFREQAAPPSITRYARNRLLRIVPAFWVVAAIALLRFGVRGSSPGQVFALFGFAQTWNSGPVDGLMVQAWTLDAEMFFYLLLAIVAWMLTTTLGRWRPSPARLAAVVVPLACVFAWSYYHRAIGRDHANTQPPPPSMLFAFAPGIALAAIEGVWGSRFRGWRHGSAVAWGLLAAGVAAVVCAIVLGLFKGPALALEPVGGGALVGGALVLQWTRARSWRLLDNRPLQWLGSRSYSLYLVHVPIVIELRRLVGMRGSAWSVFAVSLPVVTAASVLAAAVVYRFVELPFLNLRGRARPAPGEAATIVAAPAPQAPALAVAAGEERGQRE